MKLKIKDRRKSVRFYLEEDPQYVTSIPREEYERMSQEEIKARVLSDLGG